MDARQDLHGREASLDVVGLPPRVPGPWLETVFEEEMEASDDDSYESDDGDNRAEAG